MKNIIPAEIIENRIFLIRKRKVMLDSHLAELYGVSTKALNQAVKRNRDRFPADFMFQLNRGEAKEMWSHFVTTSKTMIFSRSRFVTLNRSRIVTGSQGRANLRSQIVTSSYGGRRSLPYAFTEQGVAMLSSVLKSKRAVQVNIMIMRTFVKLREIMATHIDLARKINELEQKYSKHDKYLRAIFKLIKQLLEPLPEPIDLEPKKPPIGFQQH
jgi:hypothetical protein